MRYSDTRIGYNAELPDYSKEIIPPASVDVNNGGFSPKEILYGFIIWLTGLSLVLLLTSCHTTKSIQKSHTSVDQVEQMHAALSQTATITQTITTISDTLIHIAADTTGLNFDNDTTLERFDTPTEVIIKHGKRLTIVNKARVIPVKFSRVAVTQGTVTNKATQDRSTETHSVVNTTSKHVERSTYGWMWWLLLIPVGVYVFRKKLFG